MTNTRSVLIQMDVMRTCLPASMYGDEQNMFFYKNFIVDVSVILGAKLDRAEIEAQEIVDFENLLIKVRYLFLLYYLIFVHVY